MRDRRGNYMIMFAFLLPLLVGFMAFSVDLGRLRVAKIEAEAAADAAALAALMEIRDGGTRGTALLAATEVANKNHLHAQIQGEGAAAFNQWSVDIDWGDWGWDGGAWQANNGATGAVTINLQQQGAGITMLFAPIFEAAGWYSAGTNTENFEHHALAVGKRAAMRPRDIVLAIDISRNAIAKKIERAQTRLGGFVDEVDNLQLDDDRMGVIYYAGRAQTVEPISPLSDNFTALRSAASTVEPCAIDQDAWFYFWRHFDLTTINDPEIGAAGYNYQYVAPNGRPGMEFDDPEAFLIRQALALDPALAASPQLNSAAAWAAWDLTPARQCNFWDYSLLAFEFYDERRDRNVDVGYAGDSLGTVACHEGHYLQDDPDRFDNTSGDTIQGLDCGFGANVPNTIDPATGDPVPKFGGPASVGNIYRADFSYTQAGSDPSKALLRAANLFASAGDTHRERAMVLVAGTGFQCPPTLDGTKKSTCEAQMETAAYDAADVLEVMGVDTHVVGIVPVGSDDEAFLAQLTTGRGSYWPLNDVNELDEFLTRIARNVRLQVVQ